MPHVHGRSHSSHHHHHDDDNTDGLAACLATLCLCCCYICTSKEDDCEALPSDESVFTQMIMTDNILDDYKSQCLRELRKSIAQKRERVDTMIKLLNDTLIKEPSISLKIRQAINNIVKETLVVKNKIMDDHNEVSLLESLEESLRCTTEILKTRNDAEKIQQYCAVAEYAIGKQHLLKKFLGAFMFFVGAILVGLGFTTAVGVAIGGVGAGVAICGMNIFAHGCQKSVSKTMTTLGKCLSEESSQSSQQTAKPVMASV